MSGACRCNSSTIYKYDIVHLKQAALYKYVVRNKKRATDDEECSHERCSFGARAHESLLMGKDERVVLAMLTIIAPQPRPTYARHNCDHELGVMYHIISGNSRCGNVTDLRASLRTETALHNVLPFVYPCNLS